MSVSLKQGESISLTTGAVTKAPINYKHPKRSK